MTQACIAIGIGRTTGLDPLPGAVEGARQIARWAERKCGCKQVPCPNVRLVIDADTEGKPDPVDLAAVRKAMLELLPTPADGMDRGGPADPPSRLIVYFAGHGMRSDAGDMWLLSDSYNSQEAIGIVQLRSMLATYQPGQIAMISDACRSPAVQNWSMRMNPHPVVPRGDYDPANFDQVLVDEFYAVPQFASAFMIRAKDGVSAQCIFTSVLLEALQ